MSKGRFRKALSGFMSLLMMFTSVAIPSGTVSAAEEGSEWPVVLKRKNSFDVFWHPSQGNKHGSSIAGRVTSCNANIMTVTIDGEEYLAYCMNPERLGADHDNPNVNGSGYNVKVYDIDNPILESQKEKDIILALQGVITAGGYVGGGDEEAKKLKDPYQHYVNDQGQYVQGDSSGQTPIQGGTQTMFQTEDEAYAVTKYAMWTVAAGWNSGSSFTPENASPGTILTPRPSATTVASANGWEINPNATYKGTSYMKLRTHLWDMVGWGTEWKEFNDENLYVLYTDTDGDGKQWVEDPDTGEHYIEFYVETGYQGDNRRLVELDTEYTITPAAGLDQYGLRIEKMNGEAITSATKMTGSNNGGGTAVDHFKVIADADTPLNSIPKDLKVADISARINSFVIKYGIEQFANGNRQNYALVPQNTWKDVSTEVTILPETEQSQFKFTIIKKDDKGNGLAGAKFKITNEDGSFEAEETTPSSGKVSVEVPATGVYTVVETEAPKGYSLDETPYTVTVTEDNSGTLELEIKNGKTAGLRIIKKDANTGESLEGAVFEVAKVNGTYKTQVETGTTGTVTLGNIPAGSYQVTEITPPPGYLPAKNPVQTIQVIEDTVVQLIYSNEPEDGKIKIIKTAENAGDPLSDVTFEIRRRDGAEQWTETTDMNGEINLELPADWYVITEVDAPDNVEVDSTPHTVYIAPGQTYELKLTNVIKKTLIVEKRDSKTGDTVPGMIFLITDNNGTPYGAGNCGRGQGYYETGEDGTVVFENVPTGTELVVQEIEAPPGYVLNNTKYPIKIEDDVETITIQDDQVPGLLLRKVDSDTNEPIMGATFTFEISGVPGSTQTHVTDNNGVIFLEYDEAVSVIITEIEPAPGYIVNDKPVTVKLVPNERVDVTFKNTSRPGLRIEKVDQDGEPLEGAVIEVKKADGDTIGEYTTDEQGQIFIPNLEAGVYEVREIRAPLGYELDTTVHQVTLEPGKVGRVTIVNEAQPSLEIIKVDSVTKGPIAGVTFEVWELDGLNLGTHVTDEDGRIFITDLKAGQTYCFQETKTLPGYELDSRVRQVTLRQNEITTVQVENTAKSPIYILKLDAVTNEPVAGVKFRVTKADGSLIDEVTTGPDGRATITDVESGYITVTEISVPDGYVLDNTPQTKLVDGENPVTFTFYNKPFGDLLIKKVNDATGNPLAGAVFEVKRADGFVIGSDYTSGPDGTVLVSGLNPEYTYIVTETKAPNGYEISTTPQTVVIKPGEVAEVTFRDKQIEEFVIYKAGTDGKPIAGVTFEIRDTDGVLVERATTNANGLAVVNGIKPGTYIVTEVEVPDGIILDNTPKTVVVEAGKPTRVEFINSYRAGLRIIKVVEQTGEPLPGVSFKIETVDGDLIGNYTTDEAGTIFVPMEPMTVVVTETAAPADIKVDPTPHTVNVVADKVTVLSLANTRLEEFAIYKTDTEGNPLAGAIFELRRPGGQFVTTVTSGKDGLAVVPNMEGDLIVTEIKAPNGYVLDSTPHNIHIEPGSAQRLWVENKKIEGLRILKTVEQTGEVLAGVTFRITKPNGELIGDYVTDANGEIYVELEPQDVVVTEIAVPDGIKLDSTPHHVTIKADSVTELPLRNVMLEEFMIYKTDKDGKPLAGAQFRVERPDGAYVGTFTSGANGMAVIPDASGDYIVTEIKAPDGYVLDSTPHSVHINEGEPYRLTIENDKVVGLRLKKVDQETNEPLAGATFLITKPGGDVIGEYTTDDGGEIFVELEPQTVVITEIKAPDGYVIDNTRRTIDIKANEVTEIKFSNTKLNEFTIYKTDVDGNPLAGATFDITTTDGRYVTTVTTGANGLATIPDTYGDFIVTEVRAPDGYVIDSTPHTVHIKEGDSYRLVVENDKITGLRILKTVSGTGEPLGGVKFRITRPDGGFIGEYTTASNGELYVELEPQTVVVTEISAPEGIVVDNTPRTVEIKANKVTELRLENIRLSEFSIYKVGPDGEPLAGAVFEITRPNGDEICEVTSGANGLAVVPYAEGDIVITEIKAPDGYILDSTPHTVTIEPGKSKKLTIENDAIAGLKIIKTVEQSGDRLEGVEFEIRKPNGELIGTYETNENGEIFVELEPQTVIITETDAPNGYSIDSEPRTVEIKANDITTVTYEDSKLGNILIHKVDATTGRGLYGARFLLKDEDRHTIAELVTDRDGYAELDEDIPDGTYYLEEIKAPNGYTRDSRLKKITIKNGRTEEIRWANSRTQGQIQIIKVSSESNPITGKPAGSYLEGAVFEISRADTGLVVDHAVSDYRGVAASAPLPLGRYKVREVRAPDYYAINSKEFYVELKVINDIVRIEVEDSNANIQTTVKKSGNTVVTPGTQMRYDFSDITNSSNVPLNNFYWHDKIPTDAVRLNVIHTGTWTQPGVMYRVTYATNLNNTYRNLATGLLTTQSYDLDCSPATLGLASNEYVTDFRFEFGTVNPGFREANKPMIMVTVQPGLTNGYRFANRTDVGGQYQDKWFTSDFTWVTTVNAPHLEYPKTGY